MNDMIELRKVLKILSRKWWLLILVTGLAVAAGYAVSRRQTPVYEGSVTLLVGPLLQGTQVDRNDLLVSDILAQTYANLALRQPVLQGAIDTLGLADAWTELKGRVTVALVEETQLLQIRVRADSPEKAQSIAGELAHQLTLLSPTSLANRNQDENQQFVRQRLENLRTKIEAGQKRLEALEVRESEMVGSGSAAELQDLQDEINLLEGLIAGWENSYSQFLTYITSEQSTNFLAVVEPAHASARPIQPRPLMNTLIAGAVGFGLALGLVFLLEFVDDTVKSTDELSESLGLTALGGIGYIQNPSANSAGTRLEGVALPWERGWALFRTGTGREASPGRLVTLLAPSTPVAEAFRMVRSNIQFVTAGQPVGSILVTSPAAREGKSVVVANLGIVMAQAGLRTIVVDANLRQPVLHQLFDLSNSAGLADLLRSPDLEVGSLLQNAGVEHLQVLASGDKPLNPSELLGSARMGQVLATLSKLAEVVIFDSPAVSAATDAAILANRVGGVVLVIGTGQTRTTAARHTISSLQLGRIHLLGGVLNASRSRRGWLAGVVVALVLLVGTCAVWISGRGTPAVAPPSEVLAATASPTASRTPTVAVRPTSATLVEAAASATPTAEPPATPTPAPTATATLAPTATPTLAPTATPTSSRTATVTATASRTPTTMPSPTARPAQPAPARPTATSTLLPAPALIGPLDRQEFPSDAEIVLAWKPMGVLSPDAYYMLRVGYVHLGDTWFDEVPWTRNTSWTLSEHRYLVDLCDDGQFWWSVQVVRLAGTDGSGGSAGVPLSAQSEERVLIWRRASSGGGGRGEAETPAPPPP